MDSETLTALQGSIAKWEAIVAGHGIDRGVENCPLCQKFYFDFHCNGCPVREATGADGCDGSPYIEWSFDPLEELAQAELDFLRGLLPDADKVDSEQGTKL